MRRTTHRYIRVGNRLAEGINISFCSLFISSSGLKNSLFPYSNSLYFKSGKHDGVTNAKKAAQTIYTFVPLKKHRKNKSGFMPFLLYFDCSIDIIFYLIPHFNTLHVDLIIMFILRSYFSNATNVFPREFFIHSGTDKRA